MQERDIRLQRAQNELIQIPAEEKQIADKLTLQSRDFENLKLKARQIESDRKQLELQVKSKEESIKKYQVQQFQTKKNEEFQALSHEMERAKQEIDELESRELELMDQYDEAQKAVQGEGVKVKEYEGAANRRREELQKKKVQVEQNAAELKVEIAALEKDIDPANLTRYRRILQSKGDVAIVPLEHGTNCGGCHMKVTQQTALTAKGGQHLVQCDNCGRLIYWVV